MKKLLFLIGFALLALVAGSATSKSVSAYEFPIPELGFCRDQYECHLYCEISSHRAACWSYSVYGSHVLGDETPETKVAQLGITFPVAELGNCNTISECKTFCSQEINKPACRTYALRKGLTKKETLVTRARTELGCTTAEECKAFCTEEANHETCAAFAKKYHLKTAVRNRLLEAAQALLGCTTLDQCKAMCQLPENEANCEKLRTTFGKKDTEREDLLEKAKSELGCDSLAACKQLCEVAENKDKCRIFGQGVKRRVGETKEPGDCGTNVECRRACEANPEKCPQFPRTKLPELRSGETRRTGSSSAESQELNAVEKELEDTDSSELDAQINNL